MGFLLEGLREILPPHTIFHSIPPGSGDIALHRCGWEWETDQAASFPFSFLSLLSLAGRGGGGGGGGMGTVYICTVHAGCMYIPDILPHFALYLCITTHEHTV